MQLRGCGGVAAGVAVLGVPVAGAVVVAPGADGAGDVGVPLVVGLALPFVGEVVLVLGAVPETGAVFEAGVGLAGVAVPEAGSEVSVVGVVVEGAFVEDAPSEVLLLAGDAAFTAGDVAVAVDFFVVSLPGVCALAEDCVLVFVGEDDGVPVFEDPAAGIGVLVGVGLPEAGSGLVVEGV